LTAGFSSCLTIVGVALTSSMTGSTSLTGSTTAVFTGLTGSLTGVTFSGVLGFLVSERSSLETPGNSGKGVRSSPLLPAGMYDTPSSY